MADHDGHKKCQRCSRDCLTCISYSNCTKCNDRLNFSFILSNGYCNLPCGVKTYSYYRRRSTTIFSLANCTNFTCSSNCSTCFGTSSYNCLTCKVVNGVYQVLNDYQCMNSCPSGKYNMSRECDWCALTCATCSGPSEYECLSCPSGQVLYMGKCLTTCPVGTYFNSSSSNYGCKACPINCTACINSTNCTVCQPGLHYNNGLCLTTCPLRYYLSFITLNCVACDTNCESCISSLCFRCVNKTSPQYYLSNGKCVQTCEFGKHPTLNNTCEWDDPLCANYTLNSSGSFCSACNYFSPMLLLVNNSCQYTCPQGFYLSSTSRTCTACASNCA